jgi:large subunit ribosomal protein L15
VEYHALNLDTVLKAFPGQEEVRLIEIYDRGLSPRHKPVKVLARGEIERPIRIEAHKFSTQATLKIKAAGGSVVAVEG